MKFTLQARSKHGHRLGIYDDPSGQGAGAAAAGCRQPATGPVDAMQTMQQPQPAGHVTAQRATDSSSTLLASSSCT